MIPMQQPNMQPDLGLMMNSGGPQVGAAGLQMDPMMSLQMAMGLQDPLALAMQGRGAAGPQLPPLAQILLAQATGYGEQPMDPQQLNQLMQMVQMMGQQPQQMMQPPGMMPPQGMPAAAGGGY
jgi:hypothetical protein